MLIREDFFPSGLQLFIFFYVLLEITCLLALESSLTEQRKRKNICYLSNDKDLYAFHCYDNLHFSGALRRLF